MAGDVPTLETQETFGGYHEEIEKIVDGVLEDIRGGHVVSRLTARHNAVAAADVSQYGTELNHAVIAIVCSNDSVKRSAIRLGCFAIRQKVEAMLKTKPEFDALPEMSPAQVAEFQEIATRV